MKDLILHAALVALVIFIFVMFVTGRQMARDDAEVSRRAEKQIQEARDLIDRMSRSRTSRKD